VKFSTAQTLRVWRRSVLPVLVIGLFGSPFAQGKLLKDERTGLYFDPKVEITIGTTDGRTHTGRVKDFFPGQLILDDQGGGETVIPLHTLDERSREYFLSLRPPFDIRQGSFTMKTPFPRNEEIEVHYQLPLREGKLAPSAPNLVYYAPFHNEKGFFSRELHLRLTREHGLSVFAFHIQAKTEDFDRPETSYYFDESGWLRFVFDVQKRVLEETGLPYRKLLVMGNSAGSTMAANLAIHYPQWVEAASFVGGGRFDEPTEECATVKWFVCHTMEDRSDAENREFVEKLQRLGASVLYAISPSIWTDRNKSVHFHHSPNDRASFATGDFLADIAAARRPGGEPSDPAEWTVTVEEGTPALAGDTDHPAVSSWHEPLPGPRIAAYAPLRLMPLQTRLIEGGQGRIPAIVAEPTGGSPAAIVVYVPEPESGSPDPLYYLADHGRVGVGLEIDPAMPGRDLLQVQDWIFSIEDWEDLPVYYVGSEATWPILRQLYEEPVRRDHGIFLIAPESAKPSPPPGGIDDIPLYVLDVRPGAEELKVASDHPLHASGLETSRWIKIPGKEIWENGLRWQFLWETITGMSL